MGIKVSDSGVDRPFIAASCDPSLSMGCGGGDERPKSCRSLPAGAEGVCGRLADGHHYPLDNRGSTEACIRPSRRDGWLVSSTREVHVAGGRRLSRVRRRP